IRRSAAVFASPSCHNRRSVCSVDACLDAYLLSRPLSKGISFRKRGSLVLHFKLPCVQAFRLIDGSPDFSIRSRVWRIPAPCTSEPIMVDMGIYKLGPTDLSCCHVCSVRRRADLLSEFKGRKHVMGHLCRLWMRHTGVQQSCHGGLLCHGDAANVFSDRSGLLD